MLSVLRNMYSSEVDEVMYSDYFLNSNFDSDSFEQYTTKTERRRDSSNEDKLSGMSVTNFEWLDSELILNEFSGRKATHLGQVIVIDSGCPRSLMGEDELSKLMNKLEVEVFTVKEESFRFGPSRIYTSNRKARLFIQCGLKELELEFFVIKGTVPILLGNDAMIPNGGLIDMKENKMILQKADIEFHLERSKGGHFVIPVHSISKQNEANIQGEEADVVMMMTLGSIHEEDIKNFHDMVGHSVFLAVALDEDEKSQVEKVHRYFGHRAPRRVWELFSKGNRLKGKKKAVFEVIENCKTCAQFKKSPARPKVGIPPANNFNEIVGLDLKVLSSVKGGYILWMVDLFSKMIKGKYIRDKHPETVLNALVSSWVIGDGCGPGHPTRGFWCDNGGEFLNEDVLDYAAAMNVDIKMTSANSPWQNGIVERNHATADVIVEKIMHENPSINIQDAINEAAFAKNSDINHSGFSPIQLMSGQNPVFPGLAEVDVSSSSIKSSSKYMRKLKDLDRVRVLARELDCDTKLKQVLSKKTKVNTNVEKFYNLGDPVFFYDERKKEWKKGVALVRLGKTLYLRYGNFLRRVAIEKVRPDGSGLARKEDAYLEPDDQDQARFSQEEVPAEDLLQDLSLAEKNREMASKIADLQAQIDALTSVNNTLKEELANPINLHREDDISEKCPEYPSENVDSLEKKKEFRQEKRKVKKLKKQSILIPLPKTGENIVFREVNNSDWKVGRVVGSWKKTSKYKYWKHILLPNGLTVEKDFENGIAEWHIDQGEDEEDPSTVADDPVLDDKEDVDGCFPVIIPRSEHHLPEVQSAINAEISKYKSFGAFEEVDDEGQKCIPTKWVITEQFSSGKNEPYKARMCIRGDLEIGKENIRTDSPTATKEAVKLALAIAANEKFEVKCGDIKSAYLQGELLKRKIYVRPPKEAKVEGKLWLLLQGAYGIVDGGRLFYLKLSEKLIELGMHRTHSEGAIFTYVKKGKLHGLIATHSDDLIMAGDKVFEEDIERKLKMSFQFSKIEENSFKYCGCYITRREDGSIELDQQEYIENLEEIAVPNGVDTDHLSSKEIKQLRGKIGELLWLSLMTRPDISFEVNSLSSEVATGTIGSMKHVNRLIRKVKSCKNTIRLAQLGHISELIVRVYADASYANQPDKVRSTAGRVVLLENRRTGRACITSWKTKKIGRVCRSVKSAETRALEEAIDDAVNVARLISEIYRGEVDLKSPQQIPVLALTDSKSLWESLHNTRQCEEKLLRNSIAAMKELMDLRMIEDVLWVPTSEQLADSLTKRSNKHDWLMRVCQTNIVN